MTGKDRAWLCRLLHYILVVCLVMLFPVIVFAAGKTVRVGWYQAPGLQEGTDPALLRGFNYEYLVRMAQYADWQYEYVFGDFGSLEQKLIQGEVDIIGDVAKTDERLSKYNYCAYPSCYSRMLMVCRLDDDRFAYNDYESFNGIKVATSPSSFRRAMLNREAGKHHFTVQYLEYPTDEEMLDALDNGEADVAIFSDAMLHKKYKILSEWEPAAQYFIVNKERVDLLEDMNRAMGQIQSADRFIQERLFDKYFGQNNGGLDLALTREENDFVRRTGDLTVLLAVNQRPLAYVEDGQVKGIVPAYLKLLSNQTGLNFKYRTYATVREMKEAVREEAGDIYAQVPDVYDEQVAKGMKRTQPYLTINYGLVYNPAKMGKITTLAIENGADILQSRLEKQGFNIVGSPTSEACLQAVVAQKADAAVVVGNIFEQLAYHAEYQSLIYKAQPDLDNGICLGMPESNNTVLFRILSKGVGAIAPETMSELIRTEGTLPPQYTWQDYLYRNRTLISVIITLALIVAFFILWSRRQKKYNKILEITNIKLQDANEKLSAAKLQADKANESKSAFLSSMSHDLRTPLNGVIGFTNLALKTSGEESKQAYLQKIKIAGDLLLDLVNDTLELSRLESGKLVLKPEPVEEKLFWESVVTALAPAAVMKDVHLEGDFAACTDNVIQVDPLQVKKVLLNLISNAIKYTQAGGKVSVKVLTLEPPEGRCTRRIIVEDDGIGMSEEFLSRMYEPFSQEQRSEALNVTGTGLGLSIVKRIVESMQGSIKVRSKLHEGTRFTVDLPLEHWEKKQVPVKQGRDEASIQAEQETFAGCRILLCEDIQMNAEITKLLLKNKRIQVDWAKDGLEGVELFKGSPDHYYSAILMDLRMPRLDGYAATEAIRRLDRDDAGTVPILAMTADAFEEDMRRSKEVGMNGYITKPISPALLYQTLFTALTKK